VRGNTIFTIRDSLSSFRIRTCDQKAPNGRLNKDAVLTKKNNQEIIHVNNQEITIFARKKSVIPSSTYAHKMDLFVWFLDNNSQFVALLLSIYLK
jgi:predicted ribosome-associated RNA-binding protein Tma20